MRAAARVLSEKAIQGLEAGEEVRDSRTPGFGARRLASGRVSYFFRYSLSGGRLRVRIGSRSEALTLAEARRRAEQLRQLLEEGKDPAALEAARRRERDVVARARTEERRRRRSGELDPSSLAALAESYLDLQARNLSPRWRREVESKIRSHVLPALGSRRAGDVSRAELVMLLDGVAARHSPKVAEVCRRILSALFSWAVERERLASNPCPRKARVPRGERERYLTEPEIRALWQATGELDPVLCGVWRTILLTGQRPGSVKAMRREDLAPDGDALFWSIPARFMKAGKPHRVFLSDQVRKEISRLDDLTGDSPWVFASPRPRMRGGKSPSRWATEGGGGPVEHLQASTRLLNRRVAEILGHRIEPFSPHDLRRTAATVMSELGVSGDVVDRGVLAHALQGVRRVYLRGELDRLSREALHRLGVEILRIVAGRDRPVVKRSTLRRIS